MNADHNATQSQLFLDDYAEIINIVLELREKRLSLTEIAAELNARGLRTRGKKPFSHVQILRILRRVNTPISTENGATDNQPSSEIAALKSEISELKLQMAAMQQEMSELKTQVAELTQQIPAPKARKKLVTSEQMDIEIVAKTSYSTAEVVEMARQLHFENPTLTKAEIARQLAEKTGRNSESIRDRLKKLW